jgi:hypothetical protein
MAESMISVFCLPPGVTDLQNLPRPRRLPAIWAWCAVAVGLVWTGSPGFATAAAQPDRATETTESPQSHGGAAARTSVITVKPADTGEALVNPAMGWTMHFYSNMIDNYGSRLAPADTLEDLGRKRTTTRRNKSISICI